LLLRVFGPSCFLYSTLIPEPRHIRARPKGDGFWSQVWTEAIKLLFCLGSSVNRSHFVKNLELMFLATMARNDTSGALAAVVIVGRRDSFSSQWLANQELTVCVGLHLQRWLKCVRNDSRCLYRVSSRSFSSMVGYDGKDTSSLVVSLRDKAMMCFKPKICEPLSNTNESKTQKKCEGKPIFRTHR